MAVFTEQEINDLTLKSVPESTDEIELQETGGGASIKTTVADITSSIAVGIGDMAKAVYDPTAVAGDVFDRANHTGTQTLATISDVGAKLGIHVIDYIDAAEHAAIADKTSTFDALPAMNTALAAAAAAGTNLILPYGLLNVNGTFTNTHPNVEIIGRGSGWQTDHAAASSGSLTNPELVSCGTCIKRITATGGAVVAIKRASSATKYNPAATGISGVYIDGNHLADVGLHVTSCRGAKFDGVLVTSCKNDAVLYDVLTQDALTDPADNQLNFFNNLCVKNLPVVNNPPTPYRGIRISGDDDADSSINTFRNVQVIYREGAGLTLESSGAVTFNNFIGSQNDSYYNISSAITLLPDRASSTAYSVGDWVSPTFAMRPPPYRYRLECTTAGTTAATEPSFAATAIDGTQVDGTVTWTKRRLGAGIELMPGVSLYDETQGFTMYDVEPGLGGCISRYFNHDGTVGSVTPKDVLLSGYSTGNGVSLPEEEEATNGGAYGTNVSHFNQTGNLLVSGRGTAGKFNLHAIGPYSLPEFNVFHRQSRADGSAVLGPNGEAVGIVTSHAIHKQNCYYLDDSDVKTLMTTIRSWANDSIGLDAKIEFFAKVGGLDALLVTIEDGLTVHGSFEKPSKFDQYRPEVFAGTATKLRSFYKKTGSSIPVQLSEFRVTAADTTGQDSTYSFFLLNGGVLGAVMHLGGGLYMQGNTDKGAGTINATALYEGGTQLNALYADIAHNHSGVYSPVSHNHSGVYSPVSHNHSGVYSPVSHNHSGVYAPVSHTQSFTTITGQATNAQLPSSISVAGLTSSGAVVGNTLSTTLSAAIGTWETIGGFLNVGSSPSHTANGDISCGAIWGTNNLTCYPLEAARGEDINLEEWDARVENEVHSDYDEDGNKTGEHTVIKKNMDARKFKARLGTEYDPLDIDKYEKHWRDKGHLTSMPNKENFDAGTAEQISVSEYIGKLVETVEIQAVHIAQLNARLKALEAV